MPQKTITINRNITLHRVVTAGPLSRAKARKKHFAQAANELTVRQKRGEPNLAL